MNVPKSVAEKPAKKAAGTKTAPKNPVKAAAKAVPAKAPAKKAAASAEKPSVKRPVKTTHAALEKPPAKKPVKKAAAAEEKPVTRSPAKKPPRHVPEEQPEKPDARFDDSDTDGGVVDEGFRLIQSKPEGILQSELWKELGVDSRKCSRIVKRLEDSGLIERVDFKREGIKTYLLRAKQQPVNPSDLLAGDELIPCIGCELECVVEECHPLMDWMYQLAIVQHTEG